MTDVNSARRRFSLVLIVLLCLDVAAIGVLISPIGRSSRSAHTRLQQLWSQLRDKDREAMPLRGIDGKVVEAKQEIQGFFAGRLPSSYAAVSDRLNKVAGSSGITLANVRYDTEPAAVAGLDRVSIDLAISGDYLQAVKFINALERDKMFFLVNGVAVQGSGSGVVRLQLNVETYLKSA